MNLRIICHFSMYSYQLFPICPSISLDLCSLSFPSLLTLKDDIIHSGPDLPPLFVWQYQYLCPLWPVNSCMQKQILKRSLGVNLRYAGGCNFERTAVKMINGNLLQIEKTIPNKSKICSRAECQCKGNETSNYSLRN